ncbi:MAG: DMT family transporter [Hamadaea sp.]|nr:DMT family transporter [Hamadaea sp.]
MNSATTRTGVLTAFGAAAISGVAVFVNGYGVRAVPDATVYTTAKNLVAAAVLCLIALLMALRARRGPHVVRPAHRRAHWWGLAVLGVIGGSVPFVLFFEGLARASSTHAAFLQKTLVVWVALLAVPALGERLRAIHVAALVLFVGGLVVLDDGLSGFAFGAGEALVLSATLLWAIEVVLAKRLLRGFAPQTVGVARMGLGILALLAWVAVTGRWPALSGLSAAGWRWAVVTGLILAGYVTVWFMALAKAPAVDVTAILVAGAVLTGVLNTAFKGAALPAVNLAALTALLGGAVLVGVGAARRPATVQVRSR